MNAPAQLSLFEPSRADALRLLNSYLSVAGRHQSSADRFDLLGIPAAARASRMAESEAIEDACLLGMYLGFLELAGE